MGIPVWLVTHVFEPRGSSLYTLRLATRLAEHGFAPLVVCLSAARLPAAVRAAVAVREVPGLGNAATRPFAVARLAREFAAAPPALLHGQRRLAAAATAALATRFQRPYVQTIHDLVRPGATVPAARAWLRAVVVPSPSVGDDVVLHARAPAGLIRVVPTGVELSDVAAPAGGSAAPVVGMASRLEPSKGAIYFLLAAKALLDQGRALEFLVAGAGEDEGMLRRAARKLGIAPRVTFAGHVSDYLGLLRTIDLFVSPSLREGLGAALLEAMALGRPVVATRVGGLADFFADREHLLFAPPADHVALAARIGECLDDPAAAADRAAAARSLARREFDAGALAARTAALYREALAAAAPEAAKAGVARIG